MPQELLVSPQLLEKNAIPFVKVLQHPREFVVTFPGAYHAGFNYG
jgi:jumonji domain-containing protein 2